MRITPRAAEVKHVGKAIDQDHATLDAAAKAAIKAVSEALDLRDWWTLAETGQPPLLWGVYASEKEAEKAKAKLDALGSMNTLFVVPVRSMGPVLARLEGHPVGEDCPCGHPAWLHLLDGNSRGKCGLSSCDCEKYSKGSSPIPPFPTCASCRQLVLA